MKNYEAYSIALALRLTANLALFFIIILIHEMLICPIELGVMGRGLLRLNMLALAPSAVPCTRPLMFHLTSRVAGAEGGGVTEDVSTIKAAKPCASRARHNSGELPPAPSYCTRRLTG